MEKISWFLTKWKQESKIINRHNRVKQEIRYMGKYFLAKSPLGIFIVRENLHIHWICPEMFSFRELLMWFRDKREKNSGKLLVFYNKKKFLEKFRFFVSNFTLLVSKSFHPRSPMWIPYLTQSSSLGLRPPNSGLESRASNLSTLSRVKAVACKEHYFMLI